ncbi:hypothetical protein [Phocaeicola plebeius]|uniref:hypothetical protein n=1 Tax=Phocaeicola plebeius TaxID=310297 RepID=UPI00195D807E|nr:hypothetical protein [Phocaeicola plebeius]MBM6842820.1 hypothetical protein [Phocaeicola plebeius]
MRTYKMKRSEVLQVLSMATDLGYPDHCKFLSAELTWCCWHGVSQLAKFLKNHSYN